MIGARLLQLRGNLKLTQTDLAKRLKMNPSAISQMESGKIKPSLETLVLLDKYYGVNLHWLVTGKGTMYSVSGEPQSASERKLEKIRSFINEELMTLVRSRKDMAASDAVELRVAGEIAAGRPAESVDTSLDVITIRRAQINGILEEIGRAHV